MKLRFKFLTLGSLSTIGLMSCASLIGCNKSDDGKWVDLKNEQTQSCRIEISSSYIDHGMNPKTADSLYWQQAGKNYKIFIQDFLSSAYRDAFLLPGLSIKTYMDIDNIYLYSGPDKKWESNISYHIGFQIKGVYNTFNIDCTMESVVEHVSCAVEPIIQQSNGFFDETIWHLTPAEYLDIPLEAKISAILNGQIENKSYGLTFSCDREHWYQDMFSVNYYIWLLSLKPISSQLFSLSHVKKVIKE